MPQLVLICFVPLLSFSHNTGNSQMYWIFPRDMLFSYLYLQGSERHYPDFIFCSVIGGIGKRHSFWEVLCYSQWSSVPYPLSPQMEILCLQDYISAALSHNFSSWLTASLLIAKDQRLPELSILFFCILGSSLYCFQHCLNVTHNWQRKSNIYLYLSLGHSSQD